MARQVLDMNTHNEQLLLDLLDLLHIIKTATREDPKILEKVKKSTDNTINMFVKEFQARLIDCKNKGSMAEERIELAWNCTLAFHKENLKEVPDVVKRQLWFRKTTDRALSPVSSMFIELHAVDQSLLDTKNEWKAKPISHRTASERMVFKEKLRKSLNRREELRRTIIHRIGACKSFTMLKGLDILKKYDQLTVSESKDAIMQKMSQIFHVVMIWYFSASVKGVVTEKVTEIINKLFDSNVSLPEDERSKGEIILEFVKKNSFNMDDAMELFEKIPLSSLAVVKHAWEIHSQRLRDA